MPSEWLSMADELRDACEQLWLERENRLEVEIKDLDSQGRGPAKGSKGTSPSRIYALLAGYALENLLKGLLIANDPDLIKKAS